MVFAVTQIPLAIIEGLLTNVVMNILDKYEVKGGSIMDKNKNKKCFKKNIILIVLILLIGVVPLFLVKSGIWWFR